MMREILFRGKTEQGEWVYGSFIPLVGEQKAYCCIKDNLLLRQSHLCKVETVGQYTGLKDKNGKKVYVDDILYIRCGHGNCVVGKAIVYFDEKLLQYCVKEIKPYAYDSEVGDLYRDCDFSHIDEYEVIGNLHDNPELLEGNND